MMRLTLMRLTRADKPMTLRSVAYVLLSYFLAALLVGWFDAMQMALFSTSISPVRILGVAVGIYLGSGFFPIVMWSFCRFRLIDARMALYAWAVFGLMGCFIVGITAITHREKVIDYVARAGSFAGKDREIALSWAKEGCVSH